MTDCYYRRLGTDGDIHSFESTKFTASNWDSSIQHGSPPLALMTKLIEEHAAGSGQRIGRVVLDILGAIPVAPVRVRSWIQRPGARISLHQAEMTAQRPDGTWRAVAALSAWLLTSSDTAAIASDRYAPIVEGPPRAEAHGWQGAPGYLESISWRGQSDTDDGAAVAWMRPLFSLVDDDPLTDVQRLAMVVDSANGVGAALDPTSYMFMNTDTAVHLHRVPRGSDFGVRARGSIGPDGIGVTTAELFDRDGFIGTSAQTLLVQPR
ncbi:thioesterase family protein [Mycolicibacterium helvum]|uniref:Thioesterase n=1 Tax=Mycolicibacterium helvum TaxID=1534349 RepID=A0A7I7TE82_9MYCO|nr:thioesterase family protein [Mycolicibacterium helvum]BBY67517.1 thioesterase [Mycolicibacterium helvum]